MKLLAIQFRPHLAILENEIATVEAALKDPVQRPAALEQLTTKINKLAAATRSDKDTIERRAARRMVRGINSVATDPNTARFSKTQASTR